MDVEKLHDLQSVTDAALAYLPFEQLLEELLVRVVEIVSVDTAAILLLDEDGRTLVARAAKGLEEEVERGVRIPVSRGFAGRIAATGQPVRITDLEAAEILNPLLREKGLKSLLGVPLIVEGSVIGVLHVGALRDRIFTDDDVEVLQRAGDRAALVIHARLAERGRGLADALQRSLIPALPAVPGIALEGRYLPAAGARLGGDWYDAFVLPGGKLGVAIGDVAGHGFQAAALMGQLRSGLRACAMDDASPGQVATRLSGLLRQLEPGRNATLVYMALDPESGSAQIVSAGHPPPLVVDVDGRGTFLELPSSVPLGAVRYPRYDDVEATIEEGASLVLYTDGVVERPGEALDDGLQRMRAAAESTGGVTGAICGAIVDRLLPRGANRDDAALLVAGFPVLAERLDVSFPADIDAIPVLRRVLARWLRVAGASDADIEQIALACSEACANAIEHAYAPGPAAVRVSAELEDGAAVVTVRDSGQWREPRGTNRGRGRVLMEGLMDSVAVDTGPEGTTVRLALKIAAVTA